VDDAHDAPIALLFARVQGWPRRARNIYFAPSWSLIGRLGVADGHFSTSLGNHTSASLKMGAGLQYDLTKQVALRLQYERYHFVNAFGSKPNIGEYTAVAAQAPLDVPGDELHRLFLFSGCRRA
jgi:hypothetical protein